MRDEIGNRIREGHMIYLKNWGVVATVLEVKEGGLSKSPDPNDVTAAGLAVKIEIPFDLKQLGCPPGTEAQLGGILRVANPREDGLLEMEVRAAGRPS